MKTYLLFIILVLSLIFSSCNRQKKQLLILCSNDTHSQVEPKNNKGGYAARAALIDSLREDYPLSLLLDAGDFFQGTPYYNLYHGRIEIAAYNKMGYDAVTLGNHEFDLGIDTLITSLKLASFPIVCCNYDVSKTKLAGIVKPFVVVERGGMKIAIIGFGVSPEGLIVEHNFGQIKYLDPIERGNHYADSLKQAGVDFIIGVSHLGYYTNPKIDNDSLLAVRSSHIDIIFGGHTHDVRKDTILSNAIGKPIRYLKTKNYGLEMCKVVVEF